MRFLTLLLLVCLPAGNTLALELTTPKGDVILTVSGNIEHTNSAHGAQFDLAMLEALEAASLTTNSPWTKSEASYTGVRMSTLLSAVGAGSSTFKAIAFDGYWYEVSATDFDAYPVIVAYKRDDDYLTTRDLGPLWIMYPFDDYPELLTEANKASCIWHLESLIVQ